MRLLFVLFLLTFTAQAQEIKPINKYAQKYGKPLNTKYSFKAFPYHNLSFKNVPASEFNNTVIVGSCFYQEALIDDSNPVKDIFPDDMKGVIFVRCNLDNVHIPKGNIVIGGTNKAIKVQNDLSDWILDKTTLEPKEPMDKEERLKLGISIDPKDIPVEKLKENIIMTKEKELYEKANPISVK